MSVTSFKYGGTITSVGTESVNWTNPSNAGADDNSDATLGYPGGAKITYKSLRSVNFGFSTSDIPSGSTIDGIEVVAGKWKTGTDNVPDVSAYIVKGGTAGTTNYALAGSWAATETAYTYGGATDLFGTTWADTDITSSGFGFQIKADAANNNDMHIDYIKIRVYYTESGGSTRRVFIID